MDLVRSLQKVMNTPAGFDFYVAIHDLVEHIELHPAFAAMDRPVKYQQLRQIYQGIEDTNVRAEGDLGHDRYMIIQDLRQIRRNEVSDSNPLWKKRELLRAFCAKMCKMLDAETAQAAAPERA